LLIPIKPITFWQSATSCIRKGLGANVVVVVVNPRKAFEAVMDGYRVMPMADAARIGDLFIMVTGDISAIRTEHFELMQDQAIVSNSGHFNVELDLRVVIGCCSESAR